MSAPLSPDDDLTSVSDDAAVEVERQFARVFHRIRANWKRFAQELHPDLSPLGYKVLSTLTTNGPMNARALTEELHTDKSVVSRQLRQLAELGMIVSRPDETDARAKLIAVSDLTVAQLASIRARNQAELRTKLAEWGQADLALFAEFLRRLAD